MTIFNTLNAPVAASKNDYERASYSNRILTSKYNYFI